MCRGGGGGGGGGGGATGYAQVDSWRLSHSAAMATYHNQLCVTD